MQNVMDSQDSRAEHTPIAPERKTLSLPKRAPASDLEAAVLAERERCAAICDKLAKYIEDGEIPRSPDRRLRQAAKYIRFPREERPPV